MVELGCEPSFPGSKELNAYTRQHPALCLYFSSVDIVMAMSVLSLSSISLVVS